MMLLTALVLAVVPAQSQWTAKQSAVQYHLVHKFHQVDATSAKTEVIAVIDASGLKVMARSPVQSFDSGNANRDAHMLEVVEAQKFPMVVVKGAAAGFVMPAPGAKTTVSIKAEVELHGVKVQEPIDLEVTAIDAAHVHVGFHFKESLTAHKIERPALMFVQVDDELTIDGSADLEPKT
jgi:hypothetical protein